VGLSFSSQATPIYRRPTSRQAKLPRSHYQYRHRWLALYLKIFSPDMCSPLFVDKRALSARSCITVCSMSGLGLAHTHYESTRVFCTAPP
jgi:hypothetical protein